MPSVIAIRIKFTVVAIEVVEAVTDSEVSAIAIKTDTSFTPTRAVIILD